MKLKFLLCALLVTLSAGVWAGESKPIKIQGSVGKLKTIVVKPELKEGEKVPMVIICHGFTGNKNETLLKMISEGLEAEGIASVRFDFNGHGESDGAFENMTVGNELEDVACIYEYVSGLDFVDKARIGIAGHSQGGLVASLFAAKMGKSKIRCEALLAPAACIPEDIKSGKMLGAKFDPQNIPESVNVWGHKVGKAYLEYGYKLDVYKEAGMYDGKATVIHGTNDRAVPYDFGFRYTKVLKDCELQTLEGFDHGYNQDKGKAADLTVDFLKRNLVRFGSSELLVVSSENLHCDDSVLVFTPENAQGNDIPAVLLLHGYSGNYKNWPTQMDVQKLSDETGFRIICPDGFYGSWYFDDADKDKMQWRTFFWSELWPLLKRNYVLAPERTFITGLSMGGHGAMNIFLDHPDYFRGAGSMSGVLDLSCSGSLPVILDVLDAQDVKDEKVKAESAYMRLGRVKEMCTPEDIAKKIIVVSVGYYDTRFVPAAEVFRQKCLEYDLPHIFMTSPARHKWNYWTWVVNYHLSWFAEKL